MQSKIEHGAISSVGRAPDCGSGCRGFEPHIAPQKIPRTASRLVLILFTEMAKISKPTATRLLASLSDYLELKGTTGKGAYYLVKGLTKGSNFSE